MGALKVFPIATNRAQSSEPCAELILEAEIECGAFMSATNRLFGKEVARTAVALWVEEWEAGPEHFRFALADRDDIRRKPTCRSDESNPLDGGDAL